MPETDKQILKNALIFLIANKDPLNNDNWEKQIKNFREKYNIPPMDNIELLGALNDEKQCYEIFNELTR